MNTHVPTLLWALKLLRAVRHNACFAKNYSYRAHRGISVIFYAFNKAAASQMLSDQRLFAGISFRARHLEYDDGNTACLLTS